MENGEESSKNMYKGQMDKAMRGLGSGVGGWDGWVRGVGGGGMETTILEQQYE